MRHRKWRRGEGGREEDKERDIEIRRVRKEHRQRDSGGELGGEQKGRRRGEMWKVKGRQRGNRGRNI